MQNFIFIDLIIISVCSELKPVVISLGADGPITVHMGLLRYGHGCTNTSTSEIIQYSDGVGQ